MIAGAALSLAGCATVPTRVAITPGETWPELEPLLAVETGSDAMTIRVRSRGCADKADFVFRVDRRSGRTVVAFGRRRLETCKGGKGWEDMAFSYEELGLKRGERVVVANPINREGGE